MRSAPIVTLVALTFLAAFAACGNDVSSTDDAQKAYLGLDTSVDKAIQLGFEGYNEVGGAPGANITSHGLDGGTSGTLSVTGTVNNSNSPNKGMRLDEVLSNYSDDGKITYNTDVNAKPAVVINLRGVGTATGTLDGSLSGSFMMSGGLTGQVSLALTFAGDILTATDGGVSRKSGTTHITGTATSPAGTYSVDVTR